jgi:ribose transport system permease protein
MRKRLMNAPRGLVFLVAMVGFFLVAPQFFGAGKINDSSVVDVSNYLAVVGPVALAVGLGMVAGEFDLSVVSSFALGGVLAAKTGGSSPIVGLLIAGGVGFLAGAVQGYIVGSLGISSVPVTLAGFLVLWGLSMALSGGGQVLYNNYSFSDWLNGNVFGVLSVNGVMVIAVFVVAAATLGFTRIGSTIRAVGGERRASQIAGIRVTRTLVITLAVGGLVAGLGGALQAYTTSAAVPGVTFDPLITAVIAAVIGGVAITGGVGSPMGIAAGVLSLGFLQEAFVVMGSNTNLVTIVTGCFLLVVALMSAPQLGRAVDMVRAQRRRAALMLVRR